MISQVDIKAHYSNFGIRASQLGLNCVQTFDRFFKNADGTVGSYRYFIAHSALFGCVHSVSDCCRSSFLIRSVLRSGLVLPSDIYVADASAVFIRGLGAEAKDKICKILDLFNFPYKLAKAKNEEVLQILGLMFGSDDRSTFIFISDSRKKEITDLIQGILDQGTLNSQEAAKIAGKALFAINSISDRRYNNYLRPITARADSLPIQMPLTPIETFSLKKIVQITRAAGIRRPYLIDDSAINSLIYTDASYEKEWGEIGGVYIEGSTVEAFHFSLHISQMLPYIKTVQDGPICYLETLAMTAAAHIWQKKIANKLTRFMVDNEAAKFAMLNKHSKSRWFFLA